MEHRSVDLSEDALKAALSELPLGGLRVFETVGSTNDEALKWAAEGAADMAVVVADEQTAGRGRLGRAWVTPRGSALAVSIVLRQPAGGHAGGQLAGLGRLTGLSALAVAEACSALGLEAMLKWPNDVLLTGRKVAGVLVENVWQGSRLEASVMGIGINVRRGSAPPDDEVRFPATSIEDAGGTSPSRDSVLRETLRAILSWRPRLENSDFLLAWESRLAFRGRRVVVNDGESPARVGKLLGLAQDGALRLLVNNEEIHVHSGEARLLPADDKMQ